MNFGRIIAIAITFPLSRGPALGRRLLFGLRGHRLWLRQALPGPALEKLGLEQLLELGVGIVAGICRRRYIASTSCHRTLFFTGGRQLSFTRWSSLSSWALLKALLSQLRIPITWRVRINKTIIAHFSKER